MGGCAQVYDSLSCAFEVKASQLAQVQYEPGTMRMYCTQITNLYNRMNLRKTTATGQYVSKAPTCFPVAQACIWRTTLSHHV